MTQRMRFSLSFVVRTIGFLRVSSSMVIVGVLPVSMYWTRVFSDKMN